MSNINMVEYNKAFNITPNSQNYNFVMFPSIPSGVEKLLCFDVNRGLYNCTLNKVNSNIANNKKDNVNNTNNTLLFKYR